VFWDSKAFLVLFYRHIFHLEGWAWVLNRLYITTSTWIATSGFSWSDFNHARRTSFGTAVIFIKICEGNEQRTLSPLVGHKFTTHQPKHNPAQCYHCVPDPPQSQAGQQRYQGAEEEILMQMLWKTWARIWTDKLILGFNDTFILIFRELLIDDSDFNLHHKKWHQIWLTLYGAARPIYNRKLVVGW